jgi:DNA polymerase-3 subunit delta
VTRITTPEQLAKAIAKRLPPITWVSGDESLLVLEAADTVRAQARTLGHAERSVLEVGAHFDASLLLGQAQAMSLFANRRLVDVRLAVKPTRELGEALQRCAASIEEDCRILVTSGRLERATVGTAWFGALAPALLLMEVSKVERDRLPQWLAERLGRQGQRAGRAVLALIADRIEGNLLAAHQELQRIALLLPPGELDPAEVEALVIDSARYDVFGMVETALAGETARALRMVDGLRAEEAALPLLGWALADNLRRLLKVRQAMATGQPAPAALRSSGVFGKREALFREALSRLDAPQIARLLREVAHLDRMAKGVGGVPGTGAPPEFGRSDPESQWAAVERIVIGLAGKPRLAAAS